MAPNANQARIGKQSFLIYALTDILSKNFHNNYITGEGTEPARKLKSYENFIKTSGTDSGCHKLSNLFSKNKDSGYFFSNIDTKLLSILVPSIKIYKVFDEWYDQINVEDGKIERKNKILINWRIPFDDNPVIFGNSTSEIVSKSFDDLLAGSGRLNGVGIKSFNYKYTGTNPAETNTSIEATLELFFQNLDDLTRRFEIQENDPRFVKATGTTDPKDPKSLKKTFSYSDLISLSPEIIKDKKGNENINYEHFRIKAIVGYAPVDSEALGILYPEKKQEEINQIKNFLFSSKVSLDLTPFSHDIKFEQDGTVILKIDYVASLDVMMDKMDILSIFGTSEKVKQLQSEFNKSIEDQQKKIDEAKKSGCADQNKQKIEEEEKKLQELQKSGKDVQVNVYNRYQSLFEQTVGQCIYTIGIDPASAGLNANDGSPIEKSPGVSKPKGNLIKFAGRRSKDFPSKLKQASSITVQEERSFFASLKDTILRTTSSDTQNTINDRVMKALNGSSVQDLGITTYIGSENKYLEINFCFFGDILDIILNKLRVMSFEGVGPDPESFPRFILGEAEIAVPSDRQTFTERDSLYIEKIKINLADVPISLDLIEIFFFEKIIKTGRLFYPIREFIKDFINELILFSFSPNTLNFLNTYLFGDESGTAGITLNLMKKNNSFRTSMMNFSLPYKRDNGKPAKDYFTENYANERFFENSILTNEKIIEIKDKFVDKIVWEDFYRTYTDTGNYLYIYVSSQLPSFLRINNGDQQKDFKDGIIHFRIGTDTSMIKEITFSKQQNQFVKEARALQGSNPNPTLLQEVYDASIKMFANDLFRPGDLLYIEPIFFTGNKAIEIQNSIGLGGYYQVIDSQTSINDNIYETTINTSLIGHISISEDGTRRIVDIDTVNYGGSSLCL